MTLDFIDLFYYVSLTFSAAAGIYYYKKVDAPYRWIAILMLLTLVSELVAKYIAFGLNVPNNVVYHVFTPLEYAIYILIFNSFLGRKAWTKFLWLSLGLLIALEIVNTLFFQPLYVFNTNTITVENAFLVILSLILFLKIRQHPSQQNLLKDGVFWFNSAVLCYYAYNVLYQGLHKMQVYLLDNPPQIIYDFNMLFSGLLYLTFTFAIYLNAKHRT